MQVYIQFIKKIEDKNNRCIHSTYRILLNQINAGNLVTITPNKLTYESQQLESNETIDSDKVQEITELLEFFSFYPAVTEKEPAYFFNSSLSPISYLILNCCDDYGGNMLINKI